MNQFIKEIKEDLENLYLTHNGLIPQWEVYPLKSGKKIHFTSINNELANCYLGYSSDELSQDELFHLHHLFKNRGEISKSIVWAWLFDFSVRESYIFYSLGVHIRSYSLLNPSAKKIIQKSLKTLSLSLDNIGVIIDQLYLAQVTLDKFYNHFKTIKTNLLNDLSITSRNDISYSIFSFLVILLFFCFWKDKNVHRNGLKPLLRHYFKYKQSNPTNFLFYLQKTLLYIFPTFKDRIEFTFQQFSKIGLFSWVESEKNLQSLCQMFHEHEWITEIPPEVQIVKWNALSPYVLEGLEEVWLGKEKQKSTGAVYTPRSVVDFLIITSIQSHFADKGYEWLLNHKKPKFQALDCPKGIFHTLLSDFKILDPAVGCGTFLIRALFFLEKILSQGQATQQPDIDIRLKLLSKNLYGIDISWQSLMICLFRLYLTLEPKLQEKRILRPNLYHGNFLAGYISEEELVFSKHSKKDLNKVYYQQLASEGVTLPKNLFPFHWLDNHSLTSFDRKFLRFDIIVGNPPYFAVETYGKPYQGYFRNHNFWKNHFRGKADIYYYFIIRSIALLNEGGHLGFIIPRYWLEATHADKLREFLLQTISIKLLIDFRQNRVFSKNISTHNSILLVKKEQALKNHQFRFINAIEAIEHLELFLKRLRTTWSEVESPLLSQAFQASLNFKGWVFVDVVSQEILDKLENNNKVLSLEQLCIIGEGVKTGNDHIFASFKSTDNKKVVNVHEKVPVEYGIEQALFNPVLCKSDEIEPFFINWNGYYLLKVLKNTKLSDYPNAKAYLSKYRKTVSGFKISLKPLEERYAVKKELLPWYAIVRYNKPLFQAKEKIFTYYRGSIPFFSYTEAPYCSLTNITGITLRKNTSTQISLKYLLGILNSELIRFYLSLVGKKKGNIVEYRRSTLSDIPIALASKEKMCNLVRIVEAILEKGSPVDSKLEQELNSVVYDIYDISLPQQRHIKGFLRQTAEVNNKSKVMVLSSYPQQLLKNQSWIIEESKIRELLFHLISHKNSRTLEEITHIGEGIKTGNDKIFAGLLAHSRDESLFYNPYENQLRYYSLEKELLHPVLTSKSEISAFQINWEGFYLIYCLKTTNIGAYPNIRSYLEQYKYEAPFARKTAKGLIKRAEIDPSYWFVLQRPRISRGIFQAKKKLLCYYRTPKPEFAIDTNQFFCLTNFTAVSLKDKCPVSTKFLLGILNSCVIEFFLRETAKKKGPIIECRRSTLKPVPIPIIPPKQQKEIEKIVEQIILETDNQPMQTDLQKQLNNLVCGAYGLTSPQKELLLTRIEMWKKL